MRNVTLRVLGTCGGEGLEDKAYPRYFVVDIISEVFLKDLPGSLLPRQLEFQMLSIVGDAKHVLDNHKRDGKNNLDCRIARKYAIEFIDYRRREISEQYRKEVFASGTAHRYTSMPLSTLTQPRVSSLTAAPTAPI
ncbi:hypothetical protein Tco_0367331 [Tanacetum coccineum]